MKSSNQLASPLPASWPAAKPIALSVSVMLEGWTDDAAPGIGPMGNPLKAGVLDLQARSWAEYGPQAGAWRLLEVLEKAGISAVFYVSGIIAERYPDLVQAIVKAGHGVAAHSWTQSSIPAYLGPEDELNDIRRCVVELEKASGAKPEGWMSPRCTPSVETASLLASQAFLWHGDIFDTDLPYIRNTRSGPIVAIPFTMEVNDMPIYVRYGSEPEAFTRVLQRIVSEYPAISNKPFCLDLTVHAHVFGRPYGAIEFAKSLELVARPDSATWVTNHAALAHLFAPGRASSEAAQ